MADRVLKSGRTGTKIARWRPRPAGAGPIAGGTPTATPESRHPRYEADENPPLLTSIGLGLQFSLIASATLLVTPVIVAQASGRGDAYLDWMVFASLVVVGLSTMLQVRRLGIVGAGAVLPMFTAAFSIPFCITAVVDGGPGTLTTLMLVSAVLQVVISRWLFILRRIVTPTVGGIVMMILSITLAYVVFGLLDVASREEPVAAPVTSAVTLIVVGAFTTRGNAVLRLWAPVIGIVIGCLVAAGFGIFESERVLSAPWVGIPASWPGLTLTFGVPFWTLLPAFLFMGVIISIQVNGVAIAQQRVAWRKSQAVDFRSIQGALAGAGASNFAAGLAGSVPNIVNPGIIGFTQITGVAARRVGYLMGLILIAVAFLPKVSGFLSSIPGPVMTGYLVMITGLLFVEGARTVIQTERDRQKLLVAGVSFWIGAAFQFGLFSLPNLGSVLGTVLKSGVTTGGLTAMAAVIFLELTSQRRMRFESRLHIDSLPELNEFIEEFVRRRRWGDPMRERLLAVAEETLLTLAPLDLEAELSLDPEPEDEDVRRLVVLANSEGSIADLEFIGGGNEENLEDQISQLQLHDEETPLDNEISLRLLRRYATSVQHQQYHDKDVITVQVDDPSP